MLANLLNNVPALLVLLPAAAAGGPATVLAVLIGVNAGPEPHLHRLARDAAVAAACCASATRSRRTASSIRLGALTVPPILVARYRRAVAGVDVRVLVVDHRGGLGGVRRRRRGSLDADEVTLLHVAGAASEAPARRATGLLGRRHEQARARLAELDREAAQALLDDAAERLGPRGAAHGRASGRPEHAVVEAARRRRPARARARRRSTPARTRSATPRASSSTTRRSRVLLVWPGPPPADGPPPPPPTIASAARTSSDCAP